MKILKIFLILLVPAIGIVGCKKSETKPACTHNSSSASTDPNNNQVNAQRIETPEIITDDSDPIVGSGDDDRDGGDKKKKTR